MIRPVSPLLLGLGLCVASGCASVGVGRGFSLADRLPWNRTAAKTMAEATGNDPDASAANGTESKRPAAFRTPQRDPQPAAVADATDPPFTGHSWTGRAPNSSQEPRSIAASDAAGLPIIGAGNRVDQTGRSPSGDELAANANDGATASGMIIALGRSDREDSGNPVQLQGLQVVDESGGPTFWADRSATMPSIYPGTGGQVTAAGLQTTGAFAGNHVQTVGTQAVTNPPGSRQSELERAIANAERELTRMPPGTTPATQAEYRQQEVRLRLLYLAAGHPEQALTAIPSLDPAEQEYWQQIVWAITNSLDAEGRMSAGERAVQTIPPVNTALRRLREQADLAIRNAAFCEEISYFGNYKRFPSEEFVPGQPVLLYAEIENFLSEPTPSGEYRTLLKSLIEIIGPDGQMRGWKKSFAATEDLCRNPRRDYFHNYQFTIPERLPLGPHTLKLTIVDELSGKQATSAIKFVVK